MSDINISNMNTVNTANAPKPAAAPAKPSTTKAAAAISEPPKPSETKVSKAPEKHDIPTAPKAPETEDIVSKEYGPVVAVSEDGDTVRVKNEDNQEHIHDILQKEIEELEEENEKFEIPDFEVHKIEIKETEAPEQKDIDSYVGYSDAELKRLYLEGDISQIDYNLEMDARQTRRDAIASESLDFAKSVSNSISQLNDVNSTANTVNVLENGETSNTIPDEVRIHALEALQNFDTV